MNGCCITTLKGPIREKCVAVEIREKLLKMGKTCGEIKSKLNYYR